MVPVRQEHAQSRPGYATVLQRPPSQIRQPTAHPPPPPPPPSTTTTTTTTSEIHEHMEQQGNIMNISIPKKMFPLIQLFNSLI